MKRFMYILLDDWPIKDPQHVAWVEILIELSWQKATLSVDMKRQAREADVVDR